MAYDERQPFGSQRVCEEEGCGMWATHSDSVPDPNKLGINHGECGYSIKFFCRFHAQERLEYIGNTTRLEPINPDEQPLRWPFGQPVSSCCGAEIREDGRCASCKDGTGPAEEEE